MKTLTEHISDLEADLERMERIQNMGRKPLSKKTRLALAKIESWGPTKREIANKRKKAQAKAWGIYAH